MGGTLALALHGLELQNTSASGEAQAVAGTGAGGTTHRDTLYNRFHKYPLTRGRGLGERRGEGKEQ